MVFFSVYALMVTYLITEASVNLVLRVAPSLSIMQEISIQGRSVINIYSWGKQQLAVNGHLTLTKESVGLA